MDEKSKLEIRRKIFHLALGLAIVVLYEARILSVYLLLVILSIGLLTSLASLKRRIPGVYWFLKRFEREKDMKTAPGKGTLMYVSGSLLAILLFDKNTALASILILAAGDSASYIVGNHFGRYRFNNAKHLEGLIAGIVLSSLAAMFYVSPLAAIAGGSVAMAVETLGVRIRGITFDDNILLPIVAGLAISLAQLL